MISAYDLMLDHLTAVEKPNYTQLLLALLREHEQHCGCVEFHDALGVLQRALERQHNLPPIQTTVPEERMDLDTSPPWK